MDRIIRNDPSDRLDDRHPCENEDSEYEEHAAAPNGLKQQPADESADR